MPRIRFPVTLQIACRPDTGEEFVLYTDREFAERDAVLLANMEQSIASIVLSKDEDEAAKQKAGMETFRESTRAEIKARTNREQADRDAALPYATEYDFVLVKPTWGMHLDALGVANVMNEDTGETRFNEDLYARTILSDALDGMKPKEVLDLSPTIVNELRFRLLRSISPSSSRLPFISPPPGIS